MNRIFNFSAGPCTLPLSCIEEAAGEFVDFQGLGMSLIEMSHRSKPYDDVHMAAMNDMREILEIPENFKILFLGGGATLQFTMIPMNILNGGTADYTATGTWANKAIADAKKFGTINIAFDGKADKFMTLPNPADVKVSDGSKYLHITSNETIGGIQWQEFPEVDAPIVCDMSSDIMSRRIDWSKFGVVYCGAQKNLGPAGCAVVIIRDDILAETSTDLTAYLDYKIHADKDSMYNTPPVFPIYMLGKTLKWVKAQGGIDAMAKLADDRAGLIYGAIDNSNGFYNCPVQESARSKMNIVFRLPSEDLEKQFVAEAAEKGMSGLKGHRSVGGCRASVYNAMPVEGAQALADFMAEFAAKNS